jgi:dTDP-4-dehydrorhamnose reductase
MNKYKYVIFGSSGLLGTEFRILLGPEALPLSHSQLDITDIISVIKILDEVKPEVVVNCAAWTDVDGAEDINSPENLAKCRMTNIVASEMIAKECERLGASYIGFSSDHVFGLDKTRVTPYTEEDVGGPVNQYGLSKLEGENTVLAHCSKAYMIRTCGLYGPPTIEGGKKVFVNQLLDKVSRGEKVKVVYDRICTPTYVYGFARKVMQLVNSKGPYGLYNITNSGSCNWFEFGSYALDVVNRDNIKPIDKNLIEPISSSEEHIMSPTPKVCRPLYSVLDNTKLTSVEGMTQLRDWKEALTAYLHSYYPFKS